MPRSPRIFGLDSSVFVRLLTGHPEPDFQRTLAALKRLHEAAPSTEFVVSNQVIGEAYVALQHFYGISKSDARESILQVFDRGGVLPLNGEPVIRILKAKTGAGLVDRLIAQDYAKQDAIALTHDKKMAKLEGVRLLG